MDTVEMDTEQEEVASLKEACRQHLKRLDTEKAFPPATPSPACFLPYGQMGRNAGVRMERPQCFFPSAHLEGSLLEDPCSQSCLIPTWPGLKHMPAWLYSEAKRGVQHPSHLSLLHVGSNWTQHGTWEGGRARGLLPWGEREGGFI